MVDYDPNPRGYEQYQDWFSTRKVGAINHGVPDFKDEIEELRDDIENIPWENLDGDEKVAVANIAMDACRAVCRVSNIQGDIEPKRGFSVMFHIASKLLNEVTETDDPFEGQGLGMVLADSVEDMNDGE